MVVDTTGHLRTASLGDETSRSGNPQQSRFSMSVSSFGKTRSGMGSGKAARQTQGGVIPPRLTRLTFPIGKVELLSFPPLDLP